jgi:hypothetical protein
MVLLSLVEFIWIGGAKPPSASAGYSVTLRFKIRMTWVAGQVEPVEEPVREPETAFP